MALRVDRDLVRLKVTVFKSITIAIRSSPICDNRIEVRAVDSAVHKSEVTVDALSCSVRVHKR